MCCGSSLLGSRFLLIAFCMQCLCASVCFGLFDADSLLMDDLDEDFSNLDALVPRGRPLQGGASDLLSDDVALSRALDGLLYPLIDRQSRANEDHEELRLLDCLVPVIAADRSDYFTVVGWLASRPDPASGDDHSRLKRLVNETSISHTGWQLAVDEEQRTTEHPMTLTMEGGLRLCWGQSNPGECSSNKGYLEALVLKAMEGKMMRNVRRKLEVIQVKGLEARSSFANFLLGQDSTCQFLMLSEEQCKQRYGYAFGAMQNDPHLTNDDVTRLSEAMAHQRVALIHILTSRIKLRWGIAKADAEDLVTRPKAIYATSAREIGAGVSSLIPGCDLMEFLTDLSATVTFINFKVKSDRASGDERLDYEMSYKLKDYANIVKSWRYCGVHDGQHICDDITKFHDTQNHIYRLVKLIKNADYEDSWLTGQAKLIAKADATGGSSPDAVKAARLESDAFIDRLVRLSVYQDHLTKARCHPCLGERSKAAEIPEDLVAKVERLKVYWQLNPKRLRTRRHLCNFETTTTCECRSRSDATYHTCSSFMDLVIPLMPSGRVDISNWGSINPVYAALFFLILFTYLGPEGWVARWPQRLVDAMLLAQDVPAGVEPSLQLEQTRRLSGTSKMFGDQFLVILLTFQHLSSMAMNKLMRYMQYADSDERSKDCQGEGGATHFPFVFEMFRTDGKSCFDVAQADLLALFQSDGDARWLVEVWYHMDNSNDAFWSKWMLTILGLAMNQACGLMFVFGFRPWTFPDRLNSVFYCWYLFGRYSEQTRVQAQICFDEFECERDLDVMNKVFDFCEGDPNALVDGVVGESMYADCVNGENQSNNDDLERDQAYNRMVNNTRTGRCVSLNKINRALPLRQFKLHHIKRGGRVDHYLSRRKIDDSKLKTKKKAKRPRAMYGQYASRPSGWALFLQHRCTERRLALITEYCGPGAQASPQGSDVHRTKIGKKPVKSERLKVRRKIAENGCYLKWSPFFIDLRREWRVDACLRALFELKAIQWRKPEQVAPAQVAEVTPELSFWGVGDSSGPCSLQTLAECLDEHRVPWKEGVYKSAKCGMPGLVKCGIKISNADEPSIMVKADKPFAEVPKKWVKKKVCNHVTPGLCEGKHPIEAPIVKRACLNLNTVFSSIEKFEAVGKLFRFHVYGYFVESGENIHSCVDLMCGKVRHARPRVQMFCGVVPIEFDAVGHPVKSKIQLNDRDHFNSVTSYTAVRLMIYTLFKNDKQEAVAINGIYIEQKSVFIKRPSQPLLDDLELTISPLVGNSLLRFYGNGKVVKVYPDLIPPVRRKTQDWREAAAKHRDPTLQALAKVVSSKERMKAIEKWAKKAFLSVTKGAGLAFLAEHAGVGGVKAPAGKQASPGAAAGGGPKGKGRGKGNKGKGKVPAEAEDDDNDSDEDDGEMDDWEKDQAKESESHAGDALESDVAPLGGRRIAMRWWYGTGVIVHNFANRGRGSLDSHCLVCGCAVNKTCNPRSGARTVATRSQGRPIGAIFVFLQQCPGTEDAHRKKWLADVLTFTARHAMRQMYRDAPYFKSLFEKEREEFADDVDGEPRGLWTG